MSLQISVRVRRATQSDFNRVIKKWGVLNTTLYKKCKNCFSNDDIYDNAFCLLLT